MLPGNIDLTENRVFNPGGSIVHLNEIDIQPISDDEYEHDKKVSFLFKKNHKQTRTIFDIIKEKKLYETINSRCCCCGISLNIPWSKSFVCRECANELKSEILPPWKNYFSSEAKDYFSPVPIIDKDIFKLK